MKSRLSTLLLLSNVFGLGSLLDERASLGGFTPTPRKPDPVPDPREVERYVKANRLKREAKAQRRLELNERAAKVNPAWRKPSA